MKIHTPLQLRLPQPTVYGPKEYREFRNLLTTIDHLLASGVEETFIHNHFKKSGILDPTTKQINRVHRIFRCSVLKTLTGLNYQEFATRLADSGMCQWFTGYNTLAVQKTPSKSTLERYYKHFHVTAIEKVCVELLQASSTAGKCSKLIHSDEPLAIKKVFADSTCVKAAIHFPVDWVLLRDAVRTLTKSIARIRNEGIKERMIEPALFLSKINTLAIAMTQCRRKLNSKKQRKFIFRKMKLLTKILMEHAQRYRAALDSRWEETSWSRKQTEQLLRQIDTIIKKIPQALRQAHERIIGERVVRSKDKMLSLYDEHVRIIVRGKSGAEVEFGNGLYLAEQENGLIVDWKLFKEQPPSDSSLVQESVNRITNNFGEISSYTSDRGFSKNQNNEFLKLKGIYNGICPKNPRELKERFEDSDFVKLQKRRAQTEGRIGIFKNKFLGKPLRTLDFKVKDRAVAWGVLTHNLWVIARIAQMNIEQKSTCAQTMVA